MTEREDEAWREIVDHYGERPVLDDEPTVTPDPVRRLESYRVEMTSAQPQEERFVPPPIEPAPPLAPERRVAWLALLVPPVILLVAVIAGQRLPGLLTGALVLSFLGGFGYLVATMPREREDPWDDGARV